MSNAPIQEKLLTATGSINRVWSLYFSQISDLVSGKRPFPLKSYTVVGVPPAVGNEGCAIYVSNESGGKTLAFSDGLNWRRVQDRAIIS